MEHRISTVSSTDAMRSAKFQNRMKVMDIFRRGKAVTAANIASATGLSRQTVMRAVKCFGVKNLVETAGKGNFQEAIGKRPDLFRISIHKRFLSITMWPDSVSLTLFDILGHVLGHTEVKEMISQDVDAAFSHLGTLIRTFLAEHNCNPSDIYGIGYSTSGTVNYARKELKYSAHTPGWGRDVPLGKYLTEILPGAREICVENAGKMTGSSILAEGYAKNKRAIVLFTTGEFPPHISAATPSRAATIPSSGKSAT